MLSSTSKWPFPHEHCSRMHRLLASMQSVCVHAISLRLHHAPCTCVRYHHASCCAYYQQMRVRTPCYLSKILPLSLDIYSFRRIAPSDVAWKALMRSRINSTRTWSGNSTSVDLYACHERRYVRMLRAITKAVCDTAAIWVLQISMYINSPGGVVTAGMAVYDTMQVSLHDALLLTVDRHCIDHHDMYLMVSWFHIFCHSSQLESISHLSWNDRGGWYAFHSGVDDGVAVPAQSGPYHVRGSSGINGVLTAGSGRTQAATVIAEQPYNVASTLWRSFGKFCHVCL